MNILTDKEALLVIKKLWFEKGISVTSSIIDQRRSYTVVKYKDIEVIGIGFANDIFKHVRMIHIGGEKVYHISHHCKYLSIITKKFFDYMRTVESNRIAEEINAEREKAREKISHILDGINL